MDVNGIARHVTDPVVHARLAALPLPSWSTRHLPRLVVGHQVIQCATGCGRGHPTG